MSTGAGRGWKTKRISQRGLSELSVLTTALKNLRAYLQPEADPKRLSELEPGAELSIDDGRVVFRTR